MNSDWWEWKFLIMRSKRPGSNIHDISFLIDLVSCHREIGVSNLNTFNSPPLHVPSVVIDLVRLEMSKVDGRRLWNYCITLCQIFTSTLVYSAPILWFSVVFQFLFLKQINRCSPISLLWFFLSLCHPDLASYPVSLFTSLLSIYSIAPSKLFFRCTSPFN